MLEKIKGFFINIFKKNSQKYIEAPHETIDEINNTQNTKKLDLKNQVVENSNEDLRVLKLQQDFKAGLIEEEDLSEDDFEQLTKLYEHQIEKTKQTIEKYKEKIIAIKTKMATNN